jgi:mono/diheme cytochrome c family protein
MTATLRVTRVCLVAFSVASLAVAATTSRGDGLDGRAVAAVRGSCGLCHADGAAEGGFDLDALGSDLADPATLRRWILVHDRIEKGEMPPPDAEPLAAADRRALVAGLAGPLLSAARAHTAAHGRGTLRRLTRDELEQNLRTLLQLPRLDIRHMLPEDRRSRHFDKVADVLDMSHVQLTATLDAVETALRQAVATAPAAPEPRTTRVVGTQLGPKGVVGGPQSLFYARDGRRVDLEANKPVQGDPVAPDSGLEFALFRSPGWPYAVYPQTIRASATGDYRVRFSARSVVQTADFACERGTRPVPLTFRARKPTNHDIAEDVRITGGIIDVQPEGGIYETTVHLLAGQTLEYGLLGLPVPQIDAQGKTGYYRYPPFPEGGQPGIAVQWLEMEGPIPPPSWPPASHRVLFDELGVAVESTTPGEDARRLLRRFISRAAREPVPDEAVAEFERLVLERLTQGEPLAAALLVGYQAFLCSDLSLYLREPTSAADDWAIANRLSHFLADSRPDAALADLAGAGRLRDAAVLRREAERLIDGPGFEQFVRHFTDCWLNLAALRTTDPDVALFPEYRLDDYLVDSMGRETRSFFAAMIRENLPATAVVQADFAFVNDRLARHYGLPEVVGSAVRKVTLPEDSPYGGLLTQAAVQKVTANGTSTSPVLRGVWIMDRLLGQPPPPPPPGVPAVEPDIRGATSIRDLLALHTRSTTCASCHAAFDPLGFALEHFDVCGGWRSRYRGLGDGDRVQGIDRAGHDYSYSLTGAVDASGTLADGRSFRDVRGLKALLSADARTLARNLVCQFTLYATGTPVGFADRPEVDTILDACEANGYRTRDLLLGVVTSPLFRGRLENTP